MQFDFTVENKILTQNNGEDAVISDNSDYSVHFTFDEEWTGLTKTVRFVNGKNYADVILPDNNTVNIPMQILSPPAVSVGVYAGDLHTSSPAKIKCRVSILTGSGTPKKPTDNVYSQLISCYDDVKNTLVEINSSLETVLGSEEERQKAEEERSELYTELKEHADRYSNAYVMTVNGTDKDSTVKIEHCIAGDEPLEFYATGKYTETVPSGGKSPESPSNLKFALLPMITFASNTLTYANQISIALIPGSTSDVFDIKNSKFIHNIGVGEFHIVDGNIRIFDTVRGEYADKNYTPVRVGSTSAANVFTDSFDMYPNGKAGMKTYSAYFNTAESIDGCAHGYAYDGESHYFGFGQKAQTDEDAALLFHNFVASLYENGTPLTVYYEYSEPYEETMQKQNIFFKNSSTTVSIRRMPFVIKYNADINSLINKLQSQINELASAIVAMAEGGEV